MGLAVIIVTVLIHKVYRATIKRGTVTARFDRMLLEWFACLMISMFICGQVFGV